tara:strand:- start:396 stop:605 length:210 start_codon:yes stop_codon:yes gene_type:complete
MVVRPPPGQDAAGSPIHDPDQREEAAPKVEESDVGAPDQIWPVDRHFRQTHQSDNHYSTERPTVAFYRP